MHVIGERWASLASWASCSGRVHDQRAGFLLPDCLRFTPKPRTTIDRIAAPSNEGVAGVLAGLLTSKADFVVSTTARSLSISIRPPC